MHRSPFPTWELQIPRDRVRQATQTPLHLPLPHWAAKPHAAPLGKPEQTVKIQSPLQQVSVQGEPGRPQQAQVNGLRPSLAPQSARHWPPHNSIPVAQVQIPLSQV